MVNSPGTALTWTLFLSQAAVTYTSAVWAWWACTATAPGSMTATPTITASGGQYVQEVNTAVDVWTGASPTAPIGATHGGTYAGQALSYALTPNASGSALIMAAGDGANTGTQAAGTNCYLLDTDAAHLAGEVWYGNFRRVHPVHRIHPGKPWPSPAGPPWPRSSTSRMRSCKAVRSPAPPGPPPTTRPPSPDRTWTNPANAEGTGGSWASPVGHMDGAVDDPYLDTTTSATPPAHQVTWS